MQYTEKFRGARPPAAGSALPNAVEVLRNVFYLIEHKADNLPEVRDYLELAAPELDTLIQEAQKQVGPEISRASQNRVR